MLEFDKRGMWMWFTNTELCRTADYDSQKAVTAFGEYKVGAFRKLFLLNIKEESQELRSSTMSGNKNKSKKSRSF